MLLRFGITSAGPLRWGLIRDPRGKFKTRALFGTQQAAAPAQILKWCLPRRPVDVTFHEVQAHLGVETQRQWSDTALARATPILWGLFAWMT